MTEVVLLEKNYVNLPLDVCESLHFQTGQKFELVVKGDSITLVPKPSMQSVRGILKGCNTDNVRDRYERIS